MPVLRKPHPKHKYGNPKGLPTAQYKVAKPVLNLHINGVQVAQGHTVTLTEAAARHWLREGVLQAVAATPASTTSAATTSSAPAASGSAV